ncbi:galactose mutarotase-like domain-containing protein [Cryomyces antarcticus]
MSESLEAAFSFLPQGAVIQEFIVAGHNIVQGFPTADLYKEPFSPFYGETIGRVANRIAGAKINSLNGKSYSLAVNNGPNSLHGGAKGWGKQSFEGPTPVEKDGKESVMFKYLSRDGEEGYPGTVELRLWYKGSMEKDGGVEKTSLEIEYEVELVGDEVEETAVGVTNHSYFNISGDASIEGTECTLSTNLYQVIDKDNTPTGAIEVFPGIEANETFTLGPKEPAIDHCFILNPDPASVKLDTRQSELQVLCSFYHPKSKLHFEALSTEPAFQFYTGQYIDVPAVGGLPARGPRTGFCVEPSRYINAINDDRWRSMAVLKKGQKWGSRIVYRGWKD